MARPAGFEPATTGFEAENGGLAALGTELQTSETDRVGTMSRVQRLAKNAAIRTQLVTTLLHEAAGNGVGLPGENGRETEVRRFENGVRLMTVGEVAKALRVCTATVYAMIERRELEHVRVSNAIRVVVPVFT